MNPILQKINSDLDDIKKKNRYRELRESNLIDFCSNDYLKLSNHPELIKKFEEGIKKFGLGSGASRLLRGHRKFIEEVEEEFSSWVESASSLFLANGFVSNLGLLDLLADKNTYIFSDRLNHASILDGIRLSGGIAKYYKHLDYTHLEELLSKSPSINPKIIISETVFSMDGDLANIQKLIELKEKYNSILILDEAHAIGVFGKSGAGLSLSSNLNVSSIDFRIFTCGKSLGLEGAFISGNNKIYKEYLINRMRTFIFSTAPIPAIIYSIPKSIDLIKSMEKERKEILDNADYFRKKIKEKGFSTLDSNSQIIPLICDSESNALDYSEKLRQGGYDIRAIRPPTVKKSRLRISLNVSIARNDINNVLNILN
ncbi:MAG: 8-amino-7-oxononanoate synthase [Leptospiraceae bacterium]|nr:8-amino-7-oxononanoate synthase [Leptospiraceae bacterium]